MYTCVICIYVYIDILLKLTNYNAIYLQMFKNYSNAETPQTNKAWTEISEGNRVKLLNIEFKKFDLYKNFEITKAPPNGQIEIKIDKIISADKRAILLLDLEKILKTNIDRGITVWCDPVGDKSKLRNLRGVEIST